MCLLWYGVWFCESDADGGGGCRAFTQLSADRQFAHLGLMLLGVLAQVDHAVAPFAPASATSGGGAEEQAPGADSTAPGEAAPDQDMEMSMATDMGVAVSREEIMASIERDSTPALAQPSRQPTQPHPRSISLPTTNPPVRRIKNLTDQTRGGVQTEPASKEPSLDPPKPKKKKPAQKAGDEFDDIFGGFTKPSSRKTSAPAASKTEPPLASKEGSTQPSLDPTPDPGPTKPKKKKKAREGGQGGDEFDDIFGSLDSRPKKKKKKKGGDEFDDIFGGL